MAGAKAGKVVRTSPSCTECQRRKQKCSRQWPCNHCQGRKIPHLCRYTHKSTSKTPRASVEVLSKGLSSDEDVKIDSEYNDISPANLPAFAAKNELRMLGYLPDDQNLLLGNPVPTTGITLSHNGADAAPTELTNVLRLLPPKPYTDMLIQRYMEITNFNYYCLYPPMFSHDYAVWWSDRTDGKPLTPDFTCLLMRVCACSAQYLDAETRKRLETELGESAQTLSENYHHAAKQLSNTIPPGKGGLAQIQQLFLTAAWFKAESLFVESWHAMSSAIHEAQEQGLHKMSPKTGMSEFDMEMRRRLWCLLYSWDWQMSMLLSRPLVINPLYADFKLPNMQLEGHATEGGPPSPVIHLVAQSRLGQVMTGIWLTANNSSKNSEADSIRFSITKWLDDLPPAYQENDPDTQWDNEHLYIPLQRRQLHAIGYMTMLSPYKSSLAKTFSPSSSEEERANRKTAVEIALHLMEVSHRLFDHVFPANAKFHLVTFLIFDTAAFFCSALIHDRDRSLPRREEVIQAIFLACSLLKNLAQVTKTGAVCYPVLTRLARSLSKPSTTADADILGVTSISDQPDASPNFKARSLASSIFPDSLLSSLDPMNHVEMFFPASLDCPFPGIEVSPIQGLSDLSEVDSGQFDQLWDWQNLDLTLFPPFHGN